MTKKILITGSYGLVGSAFQQIAPLYDSSYNFIFSSSSVCDLSNYEQTNLYFNNVKPDIVIHLAACVGGLYKNMNEKVHMLESNLLINFNVVKCSYNAKVAQLICMLSTCIFPDKTTYPIDESMLHNGPPHSSNDAYAYAKRMMEVQCRAYNEQYNTNFSCIIPTNIYGPYDNYSLEDGHVIPALIHKCYLAKENGVPFEVRGSGRPLRQFIYSEDLALIIMELLNKLHCDNLIISPNEEYSIGYVATLIAKEFDYEDSMVFNNLYADGQYKKTASNLKLRTMMPDVQFKHISEGLHNAVNFVKENYNESFFRR
jgi:GDP-L-fucose synthase